MKAFESFRDPSGKVLGNDQDVWRMVNVNAVADLNEFLDLDLSRKWRDEGKIVHTSVANANEIVLFRNEFNGFVSNHAEFGLFRHRRVHFPSFPYEWCPAMLRDAGLLTLDIAERFFRTTGWSIKDASPFNVLFDGPNPVFIDILSFEKRNRRDAIWLPYNQFVQAFLIPLLVNKEIGLPLRSIFLADRDGLAVSDAARLLSRAKRLKPQALSLVTLPHLLAGRAESDATLYQPKLLDSSEKASFILMRSFQRLRRQLAKVGQSTVRESKWSEYTKFNQATIPDYMRAKQAFLTAALEELRPQNVLDVGCNTGFFSFSAARAGANVVAIDYDEAVIDQVYRLAKQNGLNVLPLVVNLSRPTPSQGWRFSENPSFLDRSIGSFDMVMMLAVIHHMLVQERIPLREIMRLAADLTSRALVVEFVPPDDKMFKRLARGREHLHSNLTPEQFEQVANDFFTIVCSEKLPETNRRIYLMKKK